MTQASTSLEQRIEDKLDRSVASGIRISTQGGMLVENTNQAMEVAKLMSISKQAVPPHCRNNPGICFAVAIQSWEWAMNPFAVANKSYVVNDRLAYESALYNAVATRRAPVDGRLKITYAGSGDTRQCTVKAKLNAAEGGDDVEYTSPQFKTIQPKNSPLWKNDPDQQLFYFSVRAFVRRHFADVMMGVYTVDELQDNPPMERIVVENEAESRTKKLAATLGVDTTDKPGKTATATDATTVTADDAEPEQTAEPEPVNEPGADLDEDEPTSTESAADAKAENAAAEKKATNKTSSTADSLIALYCEKYEVDSEAAQARLDAYAMKMKKKPLADCDARYLANIEYQITEGNIKP